MFEILVKRNELTFKNSLYEKFSCRSRAISYTRQSMYIISVLVVLILNSSLPQITLTKFQTTFSVIFRIFIGLNNFLIVLKFD